MSDDLEQRFASWVEGIVAARQFWIVVGENDFNTVVEDPDQDRDLQMIYGSEAEARADIADRPGSELGTPEPVDTDDLPALCEKAMERGDAFAFPSGGGLIVAEPDVLRDELLKYAVD